MAKDVSLMTARPCAKRACGIAIDLFAGAGGLSLGFEQAGFEVVAAVEVDPIHNAIHRYNFPRCQVFPLSIAHLSGDRLRAELGLDCQSVDLVIGGPPCQGFSLMGKRVLDDPRNSLVRDFVRIVQELGPKYFLFENVKGLTVGKHRQILEEIVLEFDRIGYEVRSPWRVLNAVNYGVPQERERLFLLGTKRGLPAPHYPEPITAPPQRHASRTPTKDLLPTPTCGQALADLPDAEAFTELFDNDTVLTQAWGKPSAYAKEMRALTQDAWHYGDRRRWHRHLLTSSTRTNHSDISRRRFAETPPGSTEPISRFFKLSADGVANTLRAGTDSARGAFTSPRPIHYLYPRCITVREMARLHGFPDWFRFHRTKWHGARQIGNAVPPPLARAIAAEFIKVLGITPTPSPSIISLGDQTLLTFDMSAAAQYWGIEVPIKQRNRKLKVRPG